MISIVTPWHNGGELIPDYEAAVMGAQVVVVDNASEDATRDALWQMSARLGATYLRNEVNEGFARANNQGYRLTTGDVVMFLNSDVKAEPGWLAAVAGSVPHGYLVGPSLHTHRVAGQPLLYVEGWCIAARRETWEQVGPWSEEYSDYWTDNEICLRATRNGVGLRQVRWPISHLSNYTARRTPGAYDRSARNAEYFRRDVLAGLEQV